MKNVVNYIMQWPEKVNTALGSDATVNTFAKNLFNEPDFGTVKSEFAKQPSSFSLLILFKRSSMMSAL